MSKDKIYLPISEKFTDFVALTKSSDGLVFPLLFKEENRFHITIFIKDKEKNHQLINIHITDQIEKKQYPIFSIIITPEILENLGRKFKDLFNEIIPTIQKHFIKAEGYDKENSYCIDCMASNRPLPHKLSKAKNYWVSLNKIQPEEVTLINNCSDSSHKSYYDIKKKRHLYKVSDELFFAYDDPELFLKEMDSTFEKYFSKEFQVMSDIFERISSTIEEKRKENKQND